MFAARLGLKQAVYCHYEKGRREPSLDTLVHMALVLHRTADYLLGLSDEPAEPVPAIHAGDNAAVAVAIGNNIKQTVGPTNRRGAKGVQSCRTRSS